MTSNSSGKILAVKVRKPYTITKQREKWTDEEHTKFVDALKLYGRAWQRIEEYIGTKTAVQIRSHAQKFFAKLEKEANMKGVPFGEAQGIEIPPPRPKRKPRSPYPKIIESTNEDAWNSTLFGSCSKQAININDVSNWETSENRKCSEVPSLFHTSSSSKVSTLNMTCSLASKNKMQEKNEELEKLIKKREAQADERFINYIPIDFMERSTTDNFTNTRNHPSAILEMYANNKSKLSGFIISTLLQNPSAHAAAKVAASSGSSSKITSSENTENTASPSMAAIAAATVAAASAWWANQGLSPKDSLEPNLKNVPASMTIENAGSESGGIMDHASIDNFVNMSGMKKNGCYSCGSHEEEFERLHLVNFSLGESTNHTTRRSEAMNQLSEKATGQELLQVPVSKEALPHNFSRLTMKESNGQIKEELTCELQKDVDLNVMSFDITSSRTGFKPYKRCAVESTYNEVKNEDTIIKKSRCEGEGSN